MAFIPMIYGDSSIGDKLELITYGRNLSNGSYDYYLVFSMGIATSSQGYATSQGTTTITGGTVLKTIETNGDKTNGEYTYYSVKLVQRTATNMSVSCGSQGDIMLIGITN